MIDDRPGVALVLAVFVLMALGTTGLGLLYVSTQEVLIARAGEESARARWEAESAVRATLANWSTRHVLSLDPGDEMEVDGGEGGVRVTVVRLDGSLYLVRATTRGVARATAGALVRAVRPEALWPSFAAALSTRQAPEVDPGAAVTAAEAGHVPWPWTPELCPGEVLRSMTEALKGMEPASIIAPGDSSANAPPEWRPVLPPDSPGRDEGFVVRIGPFALHELAALADHVVSGEVQPAPRILSSGCDRTAVTNWGAPFDPGGPCGNYFPIIYAPGGVHMTGGVGQGILVVEGDLVFSGDARFYGPILVTGALVIRDRAMVLGAITHVGSASARLEGEARVDYRGCSLWRAFSGAPALDQAFAPASRTWVPTW